MSDHVYHRSGGGGGGVQEKIKRREKERHPSLIVFHGHGYSKPNLSTPEKGSRKRERGTPTGKTPQNPNKRAVLLHAKKATWSSEEKAFIKEYVSGKPRGKESLAAYWQQCADVVNEKFPTSSMRNGNACKSLAQRLLIAPAMTTLDPCQQNTSKPTFCCAATQTDLTIPVKEKGLNVSVHQEGGWIFMTPRKDLKEGASKGATLLHTAALRRLRRFADLPASERLHLIDLLCTSSSSNIARTILSSGLGEEIKCMIVTDTELEARDCASRRSVLHEKGYIELANFEWDAIVAEVSDRQPFLLDILLAAVLPTGKIGNHVTTEALKSVIGCIYGIAMKQRFHELSKVQRVISIALANEQTHQKVYDRLQPLGITLSHSTMLDTMTCISGTFNQELIDLVKSGKRFRIVGDNINFKVGVTHERQKGSQSHMEHWFGSAAVVQNIMFEDRSSSTPQCDLRRLPVESFVMNGNDWSVVKYDMMNLVVRILIDFFPWLKLDSSIMNDLSKDKPNDIKTKNKVIPLQVMKKNEQKYAEVVDILDSYQDLCESVYNSNNFPVPEVQIGGDQLTRERFYGAKRLRAAALTPSERLENLSPITFELFHLQMNFLATFYRILFSKESTEPFTLNAQKLRLVRKDVDGEDVKNHYDSCKELAESVTRAYVVEAACNILGLPDPNEKSQDMANLQSDEDTKQWVFNLANQIVSTTVSDSCSHLNNEEVRVDSDKVTCYGKLVLELGLIFLNLADIIKSPSRVRMLCLMKYIMLVLKGHNNQSKYALEIMRFLCQQFALLSEKKACESFYGLFVNTGKTIIPADLQMEYLVRLTKSHLKSMCSNVTEGSIKKRSSAFFGMEEIASKFDLETHVIHRAQKHKRPSSHEDELKIIKDLRKVKPFMHVENRQIPSMRRVPQNPITKLNIENLFSWMSQHQILMYYEL